MLDIYDADTVFRGDTYSRVDIVYHLFIVFGDVVLYVDNDKRFVLHYLSPIFFGISADGFITELPNRRNREHLHRDEAFLVLLTL